MRRLEWIAQRCPALAPDCYKMALSQLRQGINTQAYRQISARASQLLGPEYAEDPEWVEQVLLTDPIEHELDRTGQRQNVMYATLQRVP